MKKYLLYLLFIIASVNSFAQPIVQRSNASITVQDINAWPLSSLILPRYADTGMANLAHVLDSAGKMIFIPSTNEVWVRNMWPKRWTKVGAITSTTDYNLLVSGSNLNTNKTPQTLTFGSTTTWNLANGFNSRLVLTGNSTLAFTNLQRGTYGLLKVIQDGTGSRVLTVPGIGSIDLNLSPNDSTIIQFYYDNAFDWRTSKAATVSTWQQTLVAGSALDQDNDIDGGHHRLQFLSNDSVGIYADEPFGAIGFFTIGKNYSHWGHSNGSTIGIDMDNSGGQPEINISGTMRNDVLAGNITVLGTQSKLVTADVNGDIRSLPTGTSLQLLRMNSGATKPEWFTPTYISNITSLIQAGTNVTISGTGTSGDPYIINSSGGGGGGGTNVNIGAGYRWAQVFTDNIKTFFGGFGILLDSSSNSNALTAKADTFNIGTRNWVKHSIDSASYVFYNFPVRNGLQVIDGGANVDTLLWGGTLTMNTSVSGSNLYGVLFDSLTYFKVKTLTRIVDSTTYKVVAYNVTTGQFYYANWLGGGGGGGTPGGLNGQVQFNASGSFGGSANLFWDQADSKFGVGTNAPAYGVHIRFPNATLGLDGAASYPLLKFLSDGVPNGAEMYQNQSTGEFLVNVNSTTTAFSIKYDGKFHIAHNLYLDGYSVAGNRLLYLDNASLVNTSSIDPGKIPFNINTNTTDVGNIGGGEDNLMTYTVPAGQLTNDGDYLEFTMEVGVASNTNAKEIKVYFGSDVCLDIPSATTSVGGTVTIKGTIVRTGATTQKITVSYNSNVPNYTNGAWFVAATATLSGTVVLKATGTGVADNDLVQRILIAKYWPN